MVSFSEIFGDDTPVPVKKTATPAELPFEDQVGWQHSKPSASTVAKHAQIVNNAEIDAICGDCPTPEAAFPVGHEAVAELQKMVTTSGTISALIDAQLEVLAKSDEAGRFVSKNVRKSGGGIENGLRAAYAVFEDKLTVEERRLIEKAIKSLDIEVFMEIFRNGFARV